MARDDVPRRVDVEETIATGRLATDEGRFWWWSDVYGWALGSLLGALGLLFLEPLPAVPVAAFALACAYGARRGLEMLQIPVAYAASTLPEAASEAVRACGWQVARAGPRCLHAREAGWGGPRFWLVIVQTEGALLFNCFYWGFRSPGYFPFSRRRRARMLEEFCVAFEAALAESGGKPVRQRSGPEAVTWAPK